MDEIRIQEIDGRDRRIFKCACGVEIFFMKNGSEFQKYTLDTEDHECNAIRKFDKKCFDCGEDIKIFKMGKFGSWAKENLDGSEHDCKESEEDKSTGDRYWCHDCDQWHYKSHGLYSCVTDDPADDW